MSEFGETIPTQPYSGSQAPETNRTESLDEILNNLWPVVDASEWAPRFTENVPEAATMQVDFPEGTLVEYHPWFIYPSK